MPYQRIRDLPRVKKPREKLAEKGEDALKDSELLSILLRTGYRGTNVLELSKRLLSQHPLGELMEMPLAELVKLKGVGRAKACTIRAASALTRRALMVGEELFPSVKIPQDAVDQVADIRKHRKENFVLLCLNARNQIIHRETVSVGTLNASLVHPREVFQIALAKSAASVILAHNHPSGDTSPSDEDIEITRRMSEAGHVMGVEVLDHIIVSDRGHTSLKEQGVL
jgi:DNA repair protein RadC